jgi:DNA-binding PadR family transcriptional regulator
VLNVSDILRGFTDTIILGQLLHEDGYGYKINKTLRDKTDGFFELKEATLYTCFRRLENANFISSYWGGENSGARRRYYSITDEGRKLYKENVADQKKINILLTSLLKEEGEKNEYKN